MKYQQIKFFLCAIFVSLPLNASFSAPSAEPDEEAGMAGFTDLINEMDRLEDRMDNELPLTSVRERDLIPFSREFIRCLPLFDNQFRPDFPDCVLNCEDISAWRRLTTDDMKLVKLMFSQIRYEIFQVDDQDETDTFDYNTTAGLTQHLIDGFSQSERGSFEERPPNCSVCRISDAILTTGCRVVVWGAGECAGTVAFFAGGSVGLVTYKLGNCCGISDKDWCLGAGSITSDVCRTIVVYPLAAIFGSILGPMRDLLLWGEDDCGLEYVGN